MSYDLRIKVKIEGCDKYAVIACPDYDSPTYNLGKMFRACMNWDYEQGELYRCSDIIDNVCRGISELKVNKEKYEIYNPPNGWGSIDSALKTLESLWECIYEQAEEIPIEYLYMSW